MIATDSHDIPPAPHANVPEVGAVSAASIVAGIAAMTAAAGATPTDLFADVDPGGMLLPLVRRLTFGPDAHEVALAESLGFSGYLEHHLNHHAIDDAAIAAMLPFEITAPLTPRYLVNNHGPDTLIPIVVDATIRRAVFSRRQLFERVVEFWGDHFNINIRDDHQFVFKLVNDRDVIRPHALGTFPALLHAMSRSPAMLAYLDNNLNIAAHPNENYSRELLELHTMGINGGYTEQDVREVARCLTGWSVVPWQNITDPAYGTFIFNAHLHDNGAKTVLGHHIPAGGGMQDGITVMNILAGHPATIRHVCTKLARLFLGDQPPESAVTAAISAYNATGGDIKAIIRAVITPNALFQARPKIKRPFHLIASTLRTLPVSIANVTTIRYWLDSAGHLPFHWGPPNGYPDSFEAWSRSMHLRWRFAGEMGIGTFTGVTLDTASMFNNVTAPSEAAQRINDVLFHGDMSPVDRQAIFSYLAIEALTTVRLRISVGIAIASPGFQTY